MVIYTGIQLAFCTLHIRNTGRVNSYIIAILIIGLFPILPPVRSILGILASFAYLVFITFHTNPHIGVLDSLVYSDTWTKLIVVTVLVCCIAVIIYKMFAQNTLQNLQLQQCYEEMQAANKALEKANSLLEATIKNDHINTAASRRAFYQTVEEI